MMNQIRDRAERIREEDKEQERELEDVEFNRVVVTSREDNEAPSSDSIHVPNEALNRGYNSLFTPSLPYKIEKMSKLECAICLSHLLNPKKRFTLGCNHCFHKECINIWLDENRTCPICRHVERNYSKIF
mmetsp:Transcript_14371/g.16061  ORF Transcript_14371/g.16061 Transcript_14371/m.16061 type:complete len:130 (+) Transcript_14371:613-1002(+)